MPLPKKSNNLKITPMTIESTQKLAKQQKQDVLNRNEVLRNKQRDSQVIIKPMTHAHITPSESTTKITPLLQVSFSYFINHSIENENAAIKTVTKALAFPDPGVAEYLSEQGH